MSHDSSHSHRHSTSSIRKKKKKYKDGTHNITDTVKSDEITQALQQHDQQQKPLEQQHKQQLEQQQKQQHHDKQPHEQHHTKEESQQQHHDKHEPSSHDKQQHEHAILEKITTILHEDPMYDTSSHTIIATMDGRRQTSSHGIMRQTSNGMMRQSSHGAKPIDPPTWTILHDNPNMTSNVTELFTTTYGCICFTLFWLCVMIYEILQYRCIIPYAPFTIYSCVEIVWLCIGICMIFGFMTYPDTFRTTIQSNHMLSLMTLMYVLIFACLPLLGWMLFSGVLAPHSNTTIIHQHHHIPHITCIDMDISESHIIALICNIIHSICLVCMCGWCCAPCNNNREGIYIVHKHVPRVTEYTPSLPPSTPLPRQSTQVKTPSTKTTTSAILVSISDHDKMDPETPLLKQQHTPTQHTSSSQSYTLLPDPPPIAIV